MDQVLGLPQNETSIEPAISAPRDTNGNILLAIRDEHVAQDPYLSAISEAISQGYAVEITEEDYNTTLANNSQLEL